MSVTAITLPGMSATVIIEYDRRMARWEPDSRSRLEQAGLSSFAEKRLLRVDSPFDYQSKARLVIPASKEAKTFALACMQNGAL